MLKRREKKAEILMPPDGRHCGMLTGTQLFTVANSESLLLKLLIIHSD